MSSKGTSATSRKKGKISKAEKQRIQKEEEERRQREEEEAQLLAQQIEAVRLEKERLEREEIERLKGKQLERREEELGELRLLIEEKLEAAARWKRDLRIQAKWDRYMLCDGSPDPTIPQDINTFMSLWSEETDEELECVLKRSRLVLSLIEELERLLVSTPREELPEEQAANHTQTLHRLQALLSRKIDAATEHLLKRAAAMADIDTGNMQKIMKDKNVRLCIWANLNKNPRFKGFDFEEESLSFALPKPLALSSVAVRILHTVYDHLSCHSPTYLVPPREERRAEERRAEETTAPPETAEEEAKSAEEEERTVQGSVTATEEERRSEGRKSVLSSQSSRPGQQSVHDPQETSTDAAPKEAEDRGGEASEGDSLPPLPGDVTAGDLLEDDIVDLRQSSSVGGVYYFDVLALPPQCKQVNGWTMVQIVGGGLQKHPYPPESSLLTSLGASLQEKDMEGLSAPPVGVSLKLPSDVVFFEEPQVARWDPESKTWRTDQITEQRYNPERRELSFKMAAFHTFTLMQDSHLNMPYEAWELAPSGPNRVSLSIACAFTDIRLEIKDDQCRLTSVSGTDSDLSHLTNKWMTPLTLKSAMQRAGLNIFPAEDSAKYVSVNKKSEEAEKMAYKEMALLCPAFSFAWSKWNQSCGSERIVVKVKEQPDPPQDADWALYMLSAERTQRLRICEAGESFSEELYPGSEFHSTLYHMLKDYSSQHALERLQRSHHLFLDCVFQLLNMSRVLTYS